MNKEGTIITFYSYKGGVGRTFALANVAALLSLWGYRTLCIDWDLEAPGLHLYFQPWLKKKQSSGLVEMIQSYADGGKPDWREYLTEVALPGASQPLLLMQAGSLDASYVQRMQALDWNALYTEHQLGDFLEELRDTWKNELDFVLIDSRTGITDTASICTVQLPDILMLVLTANNQSLRGSLDTLESIQQSRASFPRDRARLLVVPVVSRFERRIEYRQAEIWLERFAQEFPVMYSDWAHKDITAADLLNFIRIPYIPIWNFGEEVPVLKNTSDPEDIGYSLETLAALLAQNLAATDVLINNRDQYVLTARKAIDQQITQAESLRTGVRVFISYARKDQQYLEDLRTRLKPLERQGMIQTWDDRQIRLGEPWREKIEQALDEANLILILVSPDFLASDYEYEKELMRAIERHDAGQAVAVPIIIRPTDWIETPLAKFQFLPASGRPISLARDTDEAWLDVIRSIRQIISNLEQRQRSPE